MQHSNPSSLFHAHIDNHCLKIVKKYYPKQICKRKMENKLLTHDIDEEVDDEETVPVDPADAVELLPVIQEFKELIESDAELMMLFTEMFDEVPSQYELDPSNNPQVRNYKTMLVMLNSTMTWSPPYTDNVFVGFPINAMFNYPMETNAGFAVFLNARVNQHLKLILNVWGNFLKSAESLSVLDTDPEVGWLGRRALTAMLGNETTKFEDVFKCNPTLPYNGFRSWDDFFTREFVDGQRPVTSPDDDCVIVNACESAPYRLEHHVHKLEKFWIKGQPYSLKHMFANDSHTDLFAGGTVYQGFLSPLSYHRWHSPVSGTVVTAHVIDGTYYATSPAEGYDACAPMGSEAYIGQLATR